MTRDKFLKGLNRELRGIVKQERKKYISDYEELISDLMENGMTEQEAIAKQGNYKTIAAELLNSVDDSKRVKRDVPGIIIHVLAILLSVLSLVCIILLPDIVTVGISGSGSSAVFFAGKKTELYVLYIITAVWTVLDLIYHVVRGRKGCIITACILLALLTAAFFLRKPVRQVFFDQKQDVDIEASDELSVEDKTIQVLDLFHAGDYEKLRTAYTAEVMLPYMTEESMEAAKTGIRDDWGDFVSYGRVYTSEVRQNGISYSVAQVSVSYERVSVTYTITYDGEGKIAGFYMK